MTFEDWNTDNITSISAGGVVSYKQGYTKIIKCCETARAQDCNYIWADTCCIDKKSTAELSEAINSMYDWYREAAICFAYLSDVGLLDDGSQQHDLTRSMWFTRGWTLQELLAPRHLIFFDRSWNALQDKWWHAAAISLTTKIPEMALHSFVPENHSVAARMSWAAHRETTREEDRAYSLLGIFGVHMPLLYGERGAAFQRLQEEIFRSSDDRSILLWSGPSNTHFGMFAASPASFADSSRCPIIDMMPRFMESEEIILGDMIANKGLSMQTYVQPVAIDVYFAYLGEAYTMRDRGQLPRICHFAVYLTPTRGYSRYEQLTGKPGISFCRATWQGRFWEALTDEAPHIHSNFAKATRAMVIRAPLKHKASIARLFVSNVRSFEQVCV